MARYHLRQSGYLADDEASHNTYLARVRPPKKPPFAEMESSSKLGRVLYPQPVGGNSVFQRHHRNPKSTQAFGNFLDFLTEGQVLDRLQSVVEQAAERMAALKTEAGVPLVDVQDPLEMPRGARRTRARPTSRTVHQHRTQPTLCPGRINNYPSSSSSGSDSHSSVVAGWPGSNKNLDPGARGIGSLPPVKDKLLLEKNLKRLLRLENKGKVWSQCCSQRDSLLWDSLSNQTSSQWTREQPLSWISGLVGSSSSTPEASELELGEEELMFLKQELNEVKSLVNQPASFNLPGSSSLREPYHTLDFLAEHQLFPALQNVVRQAVDKFRSARRYNGLPLFPTISKSTPVLSGNSDLLPPNSKQATSINAEDREEPYDSPTTVSSPKTVHKKSKGSGDSPSMSNATRSRLKSPNNRFTKKKPLPSISSISSLSYISNPCCEELTNFLIKQAVSLLICKYHFEDSLNKQLGFNSSRVTKALMDIFLGFKEVKGTEIRLSSDINWSYLLHHLEEAEVTRQSTKHISRSRASQRGSQLAASHVHTSQHSTGPPFTKPQPCNDTNQNQGTESRVSPHSELPIHQLLDPRDPGTAQEQIPHSLSEPKISVLSISLASSSPARKDMVVNIEDGEGNEESKGKDSEKEEGKGSSMDRTMSPGLPEPETQLEAMNPSDLP
uniref:coiled-coil domain-containing protein 116 n=1 Tax=Jaculus jaculus TaxID=51337 RepID=UPI0003330693|nr:coiled-coil domain-containing protein 116 [Jaculus jaculus]